MNFKTFIQENFPGCPLNEEDTFFSTPGNLFELFFFS